MPAPPSILLADPLLRRSLLAPPLILLADPPRRRSSSLILFAARPHQAIDPLLRRSSSLLELELPPTLHYALSNAGGIKKELKTLRYILKAFMLRRTKTSLIESGMLILPPLTEITVMVPLVPLQKKVYVSIRRKEIQMLLAFASGASSQDSLQNILRKACNHPYLFSGIEPEPYEEGEHLVQVIMRRAKKKLQLSGNVVGQERDGNAVGKDAGMEA